MRMAGYLNNVSLHLEIVLKNKAKTKRFLKALLKDCVKTHGRQGSMLSAGRRES